MDDIQKSVLCSQLSLIEKVKNIKKRRLHRELEMSSAELSQANSNYNDAVESCKSNEQKHAESKNDIRSILVSKNTDVRIFSKINSMEKSRLDSLNKSYINRTKSHGIAQTRESDYRDAKAVYKKEEIGIEKVRMIKDIILNK